MAGSTYDLLKATARSFYLTLRVLPARVRPQIGLAYLLARTTDTVADTEILPPAQRLEALHRLRERILGRNAAPLSFGELARQQGSPAERLLLERVEESLAALQPFSAADQKLIQDVLAVITSGQELDLQRFECGAGGTGDQPRGGDSLSPQDGSGATNRTDKLPTKQLPSIRNSGSLTGAVGDKLSPPLSQARKVIALKTAAELDDYTYRVAGCVGEFWTKLCRAHLFPGAKLDEEKLVADGIRFGKGLQLVNILRDLPADLQKGRCYLPLEKLASARLTPETLLRSENQEDFLRLFLAHLDLADGHLAAGWRYTNALPFGQFRVRLACAWPLLLGVKTIEKLRAADVAGLVRRVKVPRGEVYAMMLRSTLACPAPFLWRKLYFPVASGSDLA